MRKHPSEPRQERDAFHDFPDADADLCVKCALCLPHCPTYKLSRHEGDSPRGRIALMQGLSAGVLEAEGSALAHLDGCLVCRACEPVCPAEVPYGRLIDAGRTGLWRAGHRPGLAWRLLAFARRTPRRIARLERMIRFAARTRLAALASRLPLGGFARAARFIDKAGTSPAVRMQAETGEHVALFLGCLARPLDADTLHASVRVLEAMRFVADIPLQQGCCGAMDAHAGDRGTLQLHASRNVAAFPPSIPVISTASGCGVQLQDYREIAGGDPALENFAARVTDVMQFVAAHRERLPALAPMNRRAVLHAPCTLRNGMRAHGTLEVLQAIPGLAVEVLRHNDCCGAAGAYLFEQPTAADRLGNALLDALGDDAPGIFLTSNIGCALHLRRLARQRGLAMDVLHPVQLLARSIADSCASPARL